MGTLKAPGREDNPLRNVPAEALMLELVRQVRLSRYPFSEEFYVNFEALQDMLQERAR
jgi:hypothetical protein